MIPTKKLALLGFGNAGQAFAKMLLQKHDDIKTLYGYDVVVTAIATNSKGNLVDADGIDLKEALDDLEKCGKFCNQNQLTHMSTMDIVKEADYDVLVEMTPLNIFTGQPAIEHIETAFNRKKDAITANKGPIAWKFKKLRNIATDKGVKFFYETTVMDGTPVFNFAEKTLQMAKVTEVSGILNSTTNFILEELAAGAEYDDIMARGREMGFIEADPAMDIEGYDAAAKITALLNVLMDADITPDMVDRKGIEDITVEDIKAAESRGNVIKLLCKGTRDEDGSVKASVKPEEVPKGDMLASIDSTTSVVSITTDLMKTVSVVEHQPEIEQTAYGVFGDVLRVLSE
ncbi:MAG: homoserine dehydrogenase [Firmicutes bacterium]|nr:homoserine dehydrogenase [Bacillota bacterium]